MCQIVKYAKHVMRQICQVCQACYVCQVCQSIHVSSMSIVLSKPQMPCSLMCQAVQLNMTQLRNLTLTISHISTHLAI